MTKGSRSRSSVDIRWVLSRWATITPAILALLLLWHIRAIPVGNDSIAYWLAERHPAHLYGVPPGTPGAYLYSPAFAQAISPLTLLPWSAFRYVWSALLAVGFAWLLAPLGWLRAAPWFCLCLIEILMGNVYGLIAVAAVLGLRWGGAWAFVLLTKITPAVGLLWFAVRGEWGKLRSALAITAAVVAVSLAISPHAWSEWLHFLTANQSSAGTSMWPLRIAAATAITVLAARSDRAWLLAPAMVLAQPMMAHIFVGISMLAAIPRLRAAETVRRSIPARPAPDLAHAGPRLRRVSTGQAR